MLNVYSALDFGPSGLSFLVANLRRLRGETHLPTKQTSPQTPSRLSSTHVDSRRPSAFGKSPVQGPQETLGIGWYWPYILGLVDFILVGDDPSVYVAFFCDMNSDGQIDILDLLIIVNLVLGT